MIDLSILNTDDIAQAIGMRDLELMALRKRLAVLSAASADQPDDSQRNGAVEQVHGEVNGVVPKHQHADTDAHGVDTVPSGG